MDTNETTSKFLPIAVIVAGLLIAGAVLWNGSRSGTGPSGAAPKADIKDVQTDGDPFIGKADAAITIAFWSDFQCPYCKNFELGTLPQIITDYVDTGKAKVVFMDFAFLGSDSITAGLYSRAGWKLYPDQDYAWRAAFYTSHHN